MILLPNRLVRESKTVVDSGFHALDSGFQVPDSGFLVSGTWIPDSNRQWDSRFQSPGFAFPQAKISPIPESGYSYNNMGRGWTYKFRYAVNRKLILFLFCFTVLFIYLFFFKNLTRKKAYGTLRNETKRYFAKWYFAKWYFAKRYFAKRLHKRQCA